MKRRDVVLEAMKDHPIPTRRACVLIRVDHTPMQREPPTENPVIRLELRQVMQKPRRFVNRCIGIMFERKGMVMNEKVYRTLPRKGCQCAAVVGVRGPRRLDTNVSVTAADKRWSLVLLSGHLRRLPQIPKPGRERRLFSPEPCVIPDTSISNSRVARELDALFRIYGKAAYVFIQNGPSSSSRRL